MVEKKLYERWNPTRGRIIKRVRRAQKKQKNMSDFFQARPSDSQRRNDDIVPIIDSVLHSNNSGDRGEVIETERNTSVRGMDISLEDKSNDSVDTHESVAGPERRSRYDDRDGVTERPKEKSISEPVVVRDKSDSESDTMDNSTTSNENKSKSGSKDAHAEGMPKSVGKSSKEYEKGRNYKAKWEKKYPWVEKAPDENMAIVKFARKP